jgi:P2 family phage major capsid protein
MRPETRVSLNTYSARIAELNGVASVSEKFAVVPTVQQKIEQKMQESAGFLSRINIVPVDEAQGQKIGLGVGGPIASNTDTSGTNERQTKSPIALSDTGYHCRKNNSDHHITYAMLDMWAKFPNFQKLLADSILTRQALDRMTVGFNGTSYAADTDLSSNPLLQDVNIGWLQKLRLEAAQRVLTEGVTTGKIEVKAGGDYENLDALVYDMVNTLLEPWHKENPSLVAIMGSGLLHDKYFPIVNQQQPATETLAADIILSQKRVGGVPAVLAPYFPAGKVMVTTLDNLSIYYQTGGRRRHMEENAKRDRIENYESSNDAYVIEDTGLACMAENIEVS